MITVTLNIWCWSFNKAHHDAADCWKSRIFPFSVQFIQENLDSQATLGLFIYLKLNAYENQTRGTPVHILETATWLKFSHFRDFFCLKVDFHKYQTGTIPVHNFEMFFWLLTEAYLASVLKL